jgi:Ca2+-binding EF-hand superfamily protein
VFCIQNFPWLYAVDLDILEHSSLLFEFVSRISFDAIQDMVDTNALRFNWQLFDKNGTGMITIDEVGM